MWQTIMLGRSMKHNPCSSHSFVICCFTLFHHFCYDDEASQKSDVITSHITAVTQHHNSFIYKRTCNLGGVNLPPFSHHRLFSPLSLFPTIFLWRSIATSITCSFWVAKLPHRSPVFHHFCYNDVALQKSDGIVSHSSAVTQHHKLVIFIWTNYW